MRRARFRKAVVVLLWSAASAASALAAPIEATDGAAEARESRRYEGTDSTALLRASIAVLQDIRYLVTEARSAPGVVVAEAPPRLYCGPETVTVSVLEEHGGAPRVRISRVASCRWPHAQSGDFQQTFFARLDRALIRETTP